MTERDYIVESTYKVTGTAIIRATSAREAIAKGLDAESHRAEGITFYFSDAWGETKMRARPVPRTTKENTDD
jgi:hypothetical protein